MSASDTKKTNPRENFLRVGKNYVLIAIGLAAFGAVYEHFSFGVYSNYMVYGFAVPLLLGALPASLTDFFAIAALVVFGMTFKVSEVDISVAATFLLAIVGFMILFKISTPMNRFHWGVIIGCVLGLAFFAYAFRGLFSIQNISRECIMLFVLFAIATEPSMLERCSEISRSNSSP